VVPTDGAKVAKDRDGSEGKASECRTDQGDVRTKKFCHYRASHPVMRPMITQVIGSIRRV
jgi:hypothetical protein